MFHVDHYMYILFYNKFFFNCSMFNLHIHTKTSFQLINILNLNVKLLHLKSTYMYSKYIIYELMFSIVAIYTVTSSDYVNKCLCLKSCN